jgi:hypothetical protein
VMSSDQRDERLFISGPQTIQQFGVPVHGRSIRPDLA